MTTVIHSFVADFSRSESRAYEFRPFGPYHGGFSPELVVGMSAPGPNAPVPFLQAKTIVSGVYRWFIAPPPDDLYAPGAILIPDRNAQADFASAFDGQHLLFVYRHLKPHPGWLPDAFFAVAGGGDGWALDGMCCWRHGWPQHSVAAGLEVHTVAPSMLEAVRSPVPLGESLATASMDDRIAAFPAERAWVELLSHVNGPAESRIDPAVFYDVVRRTPSTFELRTAANEEYLSRLTHRIHVSVRDVHRQPMAGDFAVRCESTPLSWEAGRRFDQPHASNVVWTDRSGRYAIENETIELQISHGESGTAVRYGGATSTSVAYTDDRLEATLDDGARLSVTFVHDDEGFGPLRPPHAFNAARIAPDGTKTSLSGRLIERTGTPVPVTCAIKNDGDLLFSRAPNSASAYAKGQVKEVLTAPAHWRLQAINLSEWIGLDTTLKNRVTPLIGGKAAFAEMAAALRTITGPGHFAVLLGWNLDVRFRLIESESNSTFLEIAKAAAAHRGPNTPFNVFVLLAFTNNVLVDNARNVAKELLLENDVFCADAAALNPGGQIGNLVLTHHQKILVVHGSAGTVGFCGGIDIYPDRIAPGYHDVQAKIEGPALERLWKVVTDRWKLLPEIIERNSKTSPPPVAKPTLPAFPSQSEKGAHAVAVTNTYAQTAQYPFAPGGDVSTLNTLRVAIARARRYIYFEDQFATAYAGFEAFDPTKEFSDTVGLMASLEQAIPRLDFFLALITRDLGLPWSVGVAYRRTLFLQDLKNRFPSKVHIFGLTAPGGSAIVHSKTWIVDDVYVKIGSSNVNRRSMTFDSETDLHIVDESVSGGVRTFAKDYRKKLWAAHLGTADADSWRLDDPVRGLSQWQSPGPNAHVTPYVDFPDKPELSVAAHNTFWEGVDREGRDLRTLLKDKLGGSINPPPDLPIR